VRAVFLFRDYTRPKRTDYQWQSAGQASPVLDSEEIARSPATVPGFTIAVATAYAAGLRVGDVRLNGCCLTFRRARGGGERYAMLSPRLLRILRSHRPTSWLIPGREPGGSLRAAALFNVREIHNAACTTVPRQQQLQRRD
jgi:integrase